MGRKPTEQTNASGPQAATPLDVSDLDEVLTIGRLLPGLDKATARKVIDQLAAVRWTQGRERLRADPEISRIRRQAAIVAEQAMETRQRHDEIVDLLKTIGRRLDRREAAS